MAVALIAHRRSAAHRHDGGVATVHLVHGYLGAGKTWLARRLEDETGAIRFSADEWYMRLFAGDEPTHHLDNELWERMMRLLEGLWPAIVERGADVILDFGFWRRSARDRARTLAAASGADVVVYQVVCAEAIARQRCEARNAAPGGSFLIHQSAFDDLKAKFEPLQSDERALVVDTAG